jgi:acetolactate synthase-1/2/3 large subunit
VQPQPSSAQIARAADMLLAAKRPMVMAGSGVDRGGATAAVIDVAELLGCPVLASMAGRGSVPKDHPNSIYGFGGGGDLVRKEADLVLAVGTRIGNLDLPFEKYWGPSSSQQVIQIDVDARNIAVTRPVALGIVADARATLEALAAELRSRGSRPRAGDDLERYRQYAEQWWATQFGEVEKWDGPGIHPAHAMREIGAAFGRDAIYVTDGGMTSLWASWFLPPTRPRSYHGILELGMLGTGIPSAIGAKLANPERDVVCVSGDGAAGFNFMEMQSAAREKLPITTVVFAEGSWTMEEPSELMAYGRTFGTEMGEVRWDLVGKGLGCEGVYVTDLADLQPALERARNGNKPTVVCLHTDRDANRAVPGELFQRFFEVYQGPMG